VSTDKQVRQSWALQEIITFVALWMLILLSLAGIIHWSSLVIWASLITCVGTINGIRALAVTHKYHSLGAAPIPWSEHISDTVEIEKKSLSTFIFCPVGTQFHLTHHMFQGIPFHNLREARRRLAPHFPEDSFYHQNVRSGIRDGLRHFFRGIYSA
jgi:fatty acid desaturase